MTFSVTPMTSAELNRSARPDPDGGLGVLRTERGNLPLDRLAVQATISGLVCRTVVTTEYVNGHDTALEATYVFPLPDRAAVTGMTMRAAGHTVEAQLKERGAARQAYDAAVAEGRRASITEQERPDVFMMRVGNVLPGERVSVELRLVGPLPWEDGAATFRFPLVVAPRYVPGAPLPGPSVGDGHTGDTDAVPDASRITPPVLLPGFPTPLRLSVDVDIDPAGLRLDEVRSSLHTVTTDGGRISIAPGERADRDVVLRLPYAGDGSTLVCVPDSAGGSEGTYQLTVLPPAASGPPRARDVVLLLDRSGSMGGWKMVAARRAAARIVDTLTAADRFCVLTFDHLVERPQDLGTGLVAASDRHRFRAVEHLARVDARGGTELLAPLREALGVLGGADGDRERVLVLVTDGQVGDEDAILAAVAPQIGRTRVHAVGIDRAVNAGFLGRLAAFGAGRCELVESEDRLDEAMEHIHRRIGAPVVTDLQLGGDGLSLVDGATAPARIGGLFPGVPLVVAGRYTGEGGGAVVVRGRTRDGADWCTTVRARHSGESAVTALWARARLRDLEDRYAAGDDAPESTIVETSLRFGVLCRFTAFVAVDSRVVADGAAPRRVIQPVEMPSGWQTPDGVAPARLPFGAAMATARALPAGGPWAAPARRAAPMTFAAVTSGIGLARARSAGRDRVTLAEVIVLEARRLRDAAGRPAHERRDLLADLASRLRALLAGVTDAAYAPLHDLVRRLESDDDLDRRWQTAVRALAAFGDGPSTDGPRRRAFWKR